jgi:hypothetical protein
MGPFDLDRTVGMLVGIINSACDKKLVSIRVHSWLIEANGKQR